MSDLPHVYTSDIEFQETMVYSADTEFDSQRMGQNTNYLIDTIGPIVSQINSIAATSAKFETFNTSGGFGSGNHVIYTSAHTLLMGIVLATPMNTGLPIAQGPTGGFFTTTTPGPTVPIIISRDAAFPSRSIIFPGSYGYAAMSLGNPGPWNQVIFYLNGGGGFTFKGVLIHV